MRKLTKTTLVFALSIVAMFSCVLGLTLNGKTVKAESITVTQVEGVTDITETPFELLTNVQLKTVLGSPTENGIRFVADANGKALSDVVYGIAITANAKYDMTTENLFGEEPKYTFDKLSATDDMPFVAKYEATAEQVAELGGYLKVTLIDFSEEQKGRDLTAVCYLKNINEEGKPVYDVKAGTVSTSMQDVVKSKLEEAQGETKVALLDTYVGEADEEAYKAFAGYYTDAYKFDYNEKTKEANATITNIGVYDTKGHDKQTKATYKLYKNGTFVINTDQIIFGTYNDGVKVNGLAISKVDIEALREALSGKDKNESTYKRYAGENKETIFNEHYGVNFYNYDYELTVSTCSGGNGDFFGASQYAFIWDIIPITETFGKIYTYSTNTNSHYTGYAIGEIFYEYKVDNAGTYKGGYMSLKYGVNPVADKYSCRIPQNHFEEFYCTNCYTISEKTLGHPLYGEEGKPNIVDKTVELSKFADANLGSNYVDENATLKLFSAENIEWTFNKDTQTRDIEAGRAIFNDGTNEINATYDAIRIDDTKGLFFIDMSAIPTDSNADKTRFVRGTYTIDGDDINIKFTYNGVDYSLDYVAPVEVEQSVYNAFAGTYTDTYVFNADKSVTRRDLNNYGSTSGNKYSSETVKFIDNGGYKPVTGAGGARYWYKTATYTHSGYNPTETGSYILLNNGVIEITFGKDTVVGTYENGKFTVDGVETSRVDMDTLYTNLVGTYKDANSYSSTNLQFTKDTGTGCFGNWYKGKGGANNWTFDYNIIPITENFGKIEAFMTDGQTGYNGSEYGVKVGDVYKDKDGNIVDATTATLVNNISLYDFGKSVAEIYYAYENGEFRLSVSSGVSTTRGLRPTYNHFTDYTKDKVAVNDEALFTSLAKTYKDGTNTLVLSGLSSSLLAYKSNGTETTGSAFKGGTGTWNGNAITYSLIKLNETSGKIFFDMTATPQAYASRTDKTTFCQGDYVIDGSNITITFTYAGTTYTVTYTA